MPVSLSKLFNEKYVYYMQIIINRIKTKHSSIYDVLYYDVDICTKVSTLSQETLKNICEFISNVIDLENSPNELINYLHNYNYVIRDINEYKLINNLECDELKALKMESEDGFEYASLTGLFFLYKKALYDISKLKNKEKYTNLPIDALMVAKGAYIDVNKDNIIIEEIVNSSYARNKKITFEQISDFNPQKLLELHQKCKDYASISIANGIYNAPNNHSIIEGPDASYLVRKIDNNDILKANIDLTKNRFALNCSIITKNNANLYPNTYDDIVLGYSNIKSNQILFVSPYDAYTNEINSLNEVFQMTGTNNMFLTIDKLNERTYLNSNDGGYNEVVVLKNDVLEPSYILERYFTNQKFIEIAKEKNIPYVHLKTKNIPEDKDKLLSVGINCEEYCQKIYCRTKK